MTKKELSIIIEYSVKKAINSYFEDEGRQIVKEALNEHLMSLGVQQLKQNIQNNSKNIIESKQFRKQPQESDLIKQTFGDINFNENDFISHINFNETGTGVSNMNNGLGDFNGVLSEVARTMTPAQAMGSR